MAVCPAFGAMAESELYVNPPALMVLVGLLPSGRALLLAILFAMAACPASGAMAELESYVNVPLQGWVQNKTDLVRDAC